MAECCTGGVRLIYSCSGAVDVGGVADKFARKLSKSGIGNMFCLPVIGALFQDLLNLQKVLNLILQLMVAPLHVQEKVWST